MPRTARLAAPQATATAHSKLCGSTVTVDLAMDGDVVTDYGQSVKACLLGQSSASVMGREVIGSSAERAAGGRRGDAQDAEAGRAAAARQMGRSRRARAGA